MKDNISSANLLLIVVFLTLVATQFCKVQNEDNPLPDSSSLIEERDQLLRKIEALQSEINIDNLEDSKKSSISLYHEEIQIIKDDLATTNQGMQSEISRLQTIYNQLLLILEQFKNE